MKWQSSWRVLLFVLAGMLCLGCGSESAATLSEPELVDAQGTKVPVVLSPQRILTFTSGTDEIVLGLVSPRKMAGINEDLANPSRSNVATLAKQISVRLPRNPSIEAVAALRPDLVFVQSWIEAEKIEALRSLGILVVVCRTPANLEDVKFNIRLIAYATGEREQGEKLIGKMQHKITQITQQVEALPAEEKQRSIALISIMGGYGGSGCTFDEMCKYAGASNAKAGAGNQNGQVMSKEQLVQLNPDYLFLPVYENAEERENAYGAEYITDPSLASMTAIQKNHIGRPWARCIYNVSQNIVFGMQETAWVLYGDQFWQDHKQHLSVADDKEGTIAQ